MRIRTFDGAVFTGKDAKGVVKAMHRAAWYLPPRKGHYMLEVAERCQELGVIVNAETPERFLASLARNDFIVYVED